MRVSEAPSVGDDVPEDLAAEAGDAAGLVAVAADGGGDAVREAAERERLQHDVSRSGEHGVEQTFAAEERVAESADELDVVVDRLRHRHDAAGVDAHRLAGREIELDHVAAAVQEQESVSAQLLQDEAFAAEESRAEAFRERDREIDVADRAEERVPLREDRVAAQLDRKDLARNRIRQREPSVAAVAAEDAHEHRLAVEELAHQSLHHAALHPRLQLDAAAHVLHRSRLGVQLLAGAERDLKRLHDIAGDLVVHGFGPRVNDKDEG